MSYDFTDMQNLKTKIIEQAEQKQTLDTEIMLTVARWEGCWGDGEKGEGISKYKSVVTEQSWMGS